MAFTIEEGNDLDEGADDSEDGSYEEMNVTIRRVITEVLWLFLFFLSVFLF